MKEKIGTGEPVYLNTNNPAQLLEILDGSQSAPVVQPGATVRICRTENYHTPPPAGFLDQEAGVALLVTSKNQSTSGQQVCGIVGEAISVSSTGENGPTSVGDCAGGYFIAEKHAGEKGYAYGVAGQSLRTRPGQHSIGVQGTACDTSGKDGYYDSNNIPETCGVLAQFIGSAKPDGSLPKGGAGFFVLGEETQGGFNYGLCFYRFSCAIASIRDDSNSDTSYLIGGAHQFGIDFKGAGDKPGSYAQGEIRMQAGPIILSGRGSPANRVNAPVGSLYLRSDGGNGTTLWVREPQGWRNK